jgi:hypothetical protein
MENFVLQEVNVFQAIVMLMKMKIVMLLLQARKNVKHYLSFQELIVVILITEHILGQLLIILLQIIVVVGTIIVTVLFLKVIVRFVLVQLEALVCNNIGQEQIVFQKGLLYIENIVIVILVASFLAEEVDIIEVAARLVANVNQQVCVRLVRVIIVAAVVGTVLVNKKYRIFIKNK